VRYESNVRGGTVPAPPDLEAFCVRVHPGLVGALRLYCGSLDVARELTQDTLVRVCASWEQVRTMEHPEAWAHRVAINLANSQFRRRAAARRASLRDPASGPGSDGEHTVEAMVDLERAMSTLPPRQRAVVVLRYHLDLTADQVADVLKITPGAVRMLAQRARQTLAVRLGGDADAFDAVPVAKEEPHAD
jgi:RNA polymerase sigma factor (sigma-70 family)